MSAEEDEKFQSSNFCWICNKLFNVGDEKVRDHCHITGRYRCASHWSCNSHNLRGYDSHLILKEVGKFDVKISVILNGLENQIIILNICLKNLVVNC